MGAGTQWASSFHSWFTRYIFWRVSPSNPCLKFGVHVTRQAFVLAEREQVADARPP